MRPDQFENTRYVVDDYCTIRAEERAMFSALESHSRNVGKKLTVLDAGCGSGIISREIMNRGHQVTGLDFSEEAIKKAKKRGVDVIRCNLDETLPLENETYDVVWQGDILEHVFDPIGLLRESHRILRKNGILLLTVPSDVGLICRTKILFGISYQEEIYQDLGCFKHHTFFNRRLAEYMIRKANFNIETLRMFLKLKESHEIKYLPSLFYNIMMFKAKKI